MLSLLAHTRVRLSHTPCEPTESFGHALRIVLLLQNARGAICARSLASKLADSLRLIIIQNGKIIGAVTHVLINDPTTGYGIFIENMLNAAQMPMAKAS